MSTPDATGESTRDGTPARTHPGVLGHPRLHLRRTGSTNEQARALAIAGAPHGTLVTADEQTAGRGRHGRTWEAPPGASLLCSLVLRRRVAERSLSLLPLLAGVAVCDAIGAEARVKWPNDVVLERDRGESDRGGLRRLAKVAGILVEGRPQEGWAVLGVGVNVALRLQELPAEVRSRAATLARTPSAIEPLLADLLIALEARLREPTEEALDAWRERDALLGRRIHWEPSGGEGVAQGIDRDGQLIVCAPDGAIATLAAGEVHLSSGG